MTDGSLPERPESRAAGIDPKRLLLVGTVLIGGLAYLFWNDVRDVIKPPKILPPKPLAADMLAEQNRIVVQAGALTVVFSRVGGAVTGITWNAPDGRVEPILAQAGVPNPALVVELPGSEDWVSSRFDVVEQLASGGATKVVFARQSARSDLRVTKTYVVHHGAPLIDLTVKLDGIPPADWARDRGWTLAVSNAVGNPNELGSDDAQIAIRADCITNIHPVRRISGAWGWPGEAELRRTAQGKAPVALEWVAVSSRYFGLFVRPERPMRGARMEIRRTAKCAAAIALRVPAESEWFRSATFHIYAGPKQYDALAALPGRQQEAIDYWLLGREATLLLKLLHDRVVPNYGVAIILLTIVFRLLMWPVTRYNLRSMVDLKVANARLAEIDAREPPRSQAEERAWWLKEARVWEKVQRNATIGAFLPLAILLPVLLVLYHALSVGYDFYQQPFVLWIKDISARDPWFVLPALMGLAMMGHLRTMSANPAKERSWVGMSVGFTILFAFFSAGLVLFWTVDTLAGWLQLAIIKRWGRGSSTIEESERRVAEIRAERTGGA